MSGTLSYEPQLRMPLVDGWHVQESYTLISPDAEANIIASSEPLGGQDFDSESYAALQLKHQREEFDGYEEISFGTQPVFGGRPGYQHTYSWDPPDGNPVVQIQVYYAQGDRGYTATATALADEFEEFEATLRSALDSVLIIEHGRS